MIEFSVEASDGRARTGRLRLVHGVVETPMFMPVGTQATVKAMRPDDLEAVGAQIVLANTYHLHLRPGEGVVQRLGGLHRYMNWPRPILTDSGGFQVFSLAALSAVSEEGVAFRSHLNGDKLFLRPEDAVAIQAALGSDVAMCLDHLVPLPAEATALQAACARTTRWAARCKAAWPGPGALFGIVQGGTDPALRRQSAEGLCEIGFDGYALGGLSVGEPTEAMYETVAHTAPLLPGDQPRYLMGTGEPADLLHAVGEGIDLFDCVLPTRNARNGTLYTSRGRLNIKQARFREDPLPADPDCGCLVCAGYSRAYLHHLYRAKELLSMQLNTFHNLHFYLGLMAGARAAIREGCYAAYARETLARFGEGV